MQCVELHDDSENPIHCPFCGIKIAAGASEENVDAWLVGRCEHLLFAAIDEVGFEYRSERFDGAVKAAMSKKTDEEREYLEDDAYQLAELVEIITGLCFTRSWDLQRRRACILGSPLRDKPDGRTSASYEFAEMPVTRLDASWLRAYAEKTLLSDAWPAKRRIVPSSTCRTVCSQPRLPWLRRRRTPDVFGRCCLPQPLSWQMHNLNARRFSSGRFPQGNPGCR